MLKILYGSCKDISHLTIKLLTNIKLYEEREYKYENEKICEYVTSLNYIN